MKRRGPRISSAHAASAARCAASGARIHLSRLAAGMTGDDATSRPSTRSSAQQISAVTASRMAEGARETRRRRRLGDAVAGVTKISLAALCG